MEAALREQARTFSECGFPEWGKLLYKAAGTLSANKRQIKQLFKELAPYITASTLERLRSKYAGSTSKV
jgi:hypothetical protein